MSEDKWTLEPLGDSNWGNWSFKLKNILRAKDLWGLVDGSEKPPANDANEEAKLKYKRNCNRAIAMITTNISDSKIYLVTSCEDTPQGIWDTLKKHFEGKTISRKLFLMKAFFSLRMREGTSVANHIRELKDLIDKLRAVETPIEEEIQVCILLMSLTESFAPLVVALESRDEIPKLDFVISMLEDFERKHQDEEFSITRSDSALFGMKGKSSAQGHRVPAQRGRMKCFNCGKEGHFKRDCKAERYRGTLQHNAKVVEGESDALDGAFTTLINERTQVPGVWIIDSGATSHMTWDENLIENYRAFSRPEEVRLGDSHILKAYGTGTVRIKTKLGGKAHNSTLGDTLFVPKLAVNLFSVHAADSKGNKVHFENGKAKIYSPSGILQATGSSCGKLYYLHCEDHIGRCNVKESCCAVNERNQAGGLGLWHQRLGHASHERICDALRNNKVRGINLKSEELKGAQPFCEPCVEGKMSRKPFPKSVDSKANDALDLVYSDVCGPMTETLGGARYFVSFTDDYSRCSRVYFMREKSDVLKKFKEFEAEVTNDKGKRIKALRTDNGGEYVSKEFTEYLKMKGIRHQRTTPYSPQQNGVSERLNRTIVEMARAMLAQAKLPRSLWGEALNMAVYIKNRIPTRGVEGEVTPYERWYGRTPELGYMRIFGCSAYAHVHDKQRRKLDSKAEKYRLVGYSFHSRGFRLYNEAKREVVIRRDVIFDESDVQRRKVSDGDVETGYASDENESSDSEASGSMPKTCRNEVTEDEEIPAQNDMVKVKGTWLQRRELSNRATKGKRPWTFEEEYGHEMAVHKASEIKSEEVSKCHFALISSGDISEPTTIKQALEGEHAQEWKAAADAEYSALMENKTWDLVDRPSNRKVLTNKWVFRIKYHSDGSIERFKGRLVVRGFEQVHGLDYEETFAPVVKFDTIRTLLAFATQNGLLLHQMDVVTAFLNGIIDQEIYMEQPDGYAVRGQESKVCKLKRSLYGLKQSPRCWNQVFDTFLLSIGFSQSKADTCVYIKCHPFVIIAVYVDDLLVLTETQDVMDETKAILCDRFKMKDMGQLHYCLGISIVQNKENSTVYLHQNQYIENMLKKFNMSDSKIVSTPTDINVKLCKDDGFSQPVDKVLYQSLVGSLLYAAIATRPDISYAVGVVAQFCGSPNQSHLTAAKRISRYLKGTAQYALSYKKDCDIVGFSDADWAGNLDDRKSISGNLFVYGGGAISWLSKKQPVVALSTSEAEYIALSYAVQEAIWLKLLLTSFGMIVDKPITIKEDNQGAIAIAKDPVKHTRAKHIDIRFHFLRDVVKRGDIKLEYCMTENMTADILTKSVSRNKFVKCRNEMGLQVYPKN